MKTVLLLITLAAILVCVVYADEEKCLTSAGYSWCAYENKCVRPWELAKEKGLDNTRENIATYCNLKRITNETKPVTGGDSHGCFTSGGYSWCEAESKCVRPWELAKEKGIDSSPRSFQTYCSPKSNLPGSTHHTEGGSTDEHGCLSSAGYRWCAKDDKCIRPWELSKEKGIATTAVAINTYCSTCITSAGYSWCDKEQKCVRPWELASLRNIDNTPEAFQSYCSTSSPESHTTIGGSSDTHGCVSGAGYIWCAVENTCIRPWELSKQKGFQNTATNLKQYCEGLAVVTSLPDPQSSPAVAARREQIGGSSKSHGCITGAGYSWCEKENKCVRPWELAMEKNIENSAESFSDYCTVSTIGGSDGHGCVTGAGYTWCQKEGQCVRSWELAAEKNIENTVESISNYCTVATIGGASPSDPHGCVAGAGYSWCQKENKCVRPWVLSLTAGFENTAEAFQSYCRN